MRRTSWLGLLIAALAIWNTVACVPAANNRQDFNNPPEFDPLTAFVQGEVDRLSLDGAALLLIRGNQVIYERTFGLYRIDTPVPIASSSKWLSASTIMSLVEDGLVGLDDRVSLYLPEFQSSPKDQITIRQCLAFTSGLPPEHPCLDNPLITLQDCVSDIAKTSLLADPGDEFWYGGASYQIVGLIAEMVTGQTWEVVFQERIAGPLGMMNTNFYRDRNPRLPGGAVSTLRDYANFINMHLNNGVFEGKRVLSASSVAEMQADQIPGADIGHRPRIVGTSGYGLGVWREVVGAQGNALEVSCPGAFGFYPWLDHMRNLAGVFLVWDDIYQDIDSIKQIRQLVRDIVDSGS